MTETLTETLDSLQSGLLVAIIVIFLMLAANFQSFKVSAVVLATVPAVILGSLLLLLATGSTLNLQSYMGIIMSVGVSISNAVLLITNAEQLRLHNGDALKSRAGGGGIAIAADPDDGHGDGSGDDTDGEWGGGSGGSVGSVREGSGWWADCVDVCGVVCPSIGVCVGAGEEFYEIGIAGGG
jgi:uncharacterized membrane protein